MCALYHYHGTKYTQRKGLRTPKSRRTFAVSKKQRPTPNPSPKGRGVVTRGYEFLAKGGFRVVNK